MKRTRIITLLVVLALALTLVAPAFAYEPAARIPWRELADLLSALTGYHWWGFFFCYNENETWGGIFYDTSFDWREYPDWLVDEYIDYFNSLLPGMLYFGHCRNEPGFQGID